MPEFEPGTPSWVDLSTPDPEAAGRFYRELFGWDSVEAGRPEQTGGYRMFTLAGRQVAGVMRRPSEDQPPAWTTYVSVEDADATIERVTARGGRPLVGPMDVVDAGRMALFTDPEGAVIGVWQPAGHRGADVVNEPGSLNWNELATRDIEAAKPFYEGVFGWHGETVAGDGMSYTEWKLDGRSIAGGMEMTDSWPSNVPAHWLTYFAVRDADATARRAQELGGRVLVEPMTIPVGRFAVLSDPQGAVFAVMALRFAEG